MPAACGRRKRLHDRKLRSGGRSNKIAARPPSAAIPRRPTGTARGTGPGGRHRGTTPPRHDPAPGPRPLPKPAVPRDQVPPGELCAHCAGTCCRYFALAIDTPETWKEYDFLRWYLMHGRCSLFVSDGTWFLMVHADCNHLQPDNRCGIYDRRPRICREYSTDACEYDGDGRYERLFEHPDQVWEYAEATLPPREREPDGTPALPILSP